MTHDDFTEPDDTRQRMRDELTRQTAELDQAKAMAADPSMTVPLLLAWAEFEGDDNDDDPTIPRAR